MQQASAEVLMFRFLSIILKLFMDRLTVSFVEIPIYIVKDRTEYEVDKHKSVVTAETHMVNDQDAWSMTRTHGQ
jgi:hypothetical protein